MSESEIQEIIVRYSMGDRIKAFILMIADVIRRFEIAVTYSKNPPEGKKVVEWLLDSLTQEINLCQNILKKDNEEMINAKKFVEIAKGHFVTNNFEETIYNLSKAISEATTLSSKLFKNIETILN